MENNSPERQAAGTKAESDEGAAMPEGGGAPDILSVEALIAHLAVQMHVSQGQQIVAHRTYRGQTGGICRALATLGGSFAARSGVHGIESL